MKVLSMKRVQLSTWLGALLFWCCAQSSYANELNDMESTKVFGVYTVHYSTFNSLFVPMNIAQIHQLVRAKDQTLINIAVQKTADGSPVAAQVSATAKNLLQQQKSISFKTIQEPEAVYYIGALRHTNEEVFHLDFVIVPEGETQPLTFRISRKLYTEP
jgi:hypothetical protein